MSLTQIKATVCCALKGSLLGSSPRDASGRLERATRAYGVAVDLSFYLRFAAVFTLVQSCLTLINPSAPLSFRMP